MDILTRTHLQEALGELTAHAGKKSQLTWKGAFFLGAALYLFIGVLMPYLLDFLGEVRLDPKNGLFEGIGYDLLRLAPLAELPLILTGSIAGIICWAMALWKLSKELLRK